MIAYEDLAVSNRAFYADFCQQFEVLLQKGRFVLGEELAAFEQEFAAYTQMPYGIGVSSGLDALILALKAMNLPPQTEVLVPAHTYIASILAILHAGLKPVLIEPHLDTYNIDASKIEQAISPQTRVLMLVHLYGKVCDMNQILPLAEKHNLIILEDAAQAHGASLCGKKAGSWGHFSAFSFYPTKNLGALGDGGMVLCKNLEQAKQLKSLRNYGSSKKYYNQEIGYNARLDEIQAAFLRIKLRALDQINAHKKSLAQIYLKELKADFIKPIVQTDFDDVYHIFAIRHEKRNALRHYLSTHEIYTEIHYPIPPHKQPALAQAGLGHCYPITEQIHSSILSLPISYGHTHKEIERVIEVMNAF